MNNPWEVVAEEPAGAWDVVEEIDAPPSNTGAAPQAQPTAAAAAPPAPAAPAQTDAESPSDPEAMRDAWTLAGEAGPRPEQPQDQPDPARPELTMGRLFGAAWGEIKTWPSRAATGVRANLEANLDDAHHARFADAPDLFMFPAERVAVDARSMELEQSGLSPGESRRQAKIEYSRRAKEDILGSWRSVERNPSFQMNPEYKGSSSGLIEDAVRGVAGSLPDMSATAAAPGLGALSMFNSMFGQKFQELEEQGVPFSRNVQASRFNAIVQTPLELVSDLVQLKAIMGRGGFSKTVTHLAQAALGEGLTEYAQQYPDDVATLWALNPDLTPDEFRAELARRLPEFHANALHAGAAGALGGFILTGTGKTISIPLDMYLTRKQRELNSQRQASAGEAEYRAGAEEDPMRAQEAQAAEESPASERVVDRLADQAEAEEAAPGRGPGMTREEVAGTLAARFGEEKAADLMKMLDARAESWAETERRPPEEWYTTYYSRIETAPEQAAATRAGTGESGARPAEAPQEASRARAMEPAELEAAVARLSEGAPNALPVRVLPSIEAAEPHIRVEARARGSQPQAAWDESSGSVVLFADRIASPEEAARLWLHEQIGHHGVREVLGERLNPFLDEVYGHFDAEHWAGVADAYKLDLENPEHRRIAAEEYLAHLAEKIDAGQHLTPDERTVWERFVDLVRQWMRERGVETKFSTLTDADIARTLKDAGRMVMGEREPGSAQAPLYSGSRSIPTTPEENAARGLEALDHVISNKADALDAMFRPEVGFISFYWGEPGKGKNLKGGGGILHIIARRDAQGERGQDVARKMVEVLAHGEFGQVYGEGTRVNVSHDGHTAVLSLYRFGGRETWLLSGWKDFASDAHGGGDGPSKATHAEPMRTRPGAGAEATSKENITPLGADGNPLFQSAFHGSPHRGIEKTGFSTKYIGTGEGAQAYGWGMYFAKSKDVAEWYMEKLENNYVRLTMKDGRIDVAMRTTTDGSDAGAFLSKHRGDFEAAIADAKRLGEPAEVNKLEYWRDNSAKVEPVGKKGQLYEVELPDDANLMLWDKPWSEQPGHVKAVLDAALQSVSGYDGTHFNDEMMSLKVALERREGGRDEVLTGREVYKRIGEAFNKGTGNDQAASEYLRSLGIMGHKYLDGTSRGMGEGSHNFVIYDDNAVQIAQTYYQRKAREEPKGSIHFLDDGRAVLRLFRTADVTTVIHETGHMLRRQLMEPDRAAVEAWAGVADGRWTRAAEEKFATAFERYVYEGQAPTSRLRMVFSKIKRWMMDVYRSVRDLPGARLPKEIRDVFDRMMTTEQERMEEAARWKAVNPFRVESPFAPELEPHAEENPLAGVTDASLRYWEDVQAEAERRADTVIAERRAKEQRAMEREAMRTWKEEAREYVDSIPAHQHMADIVSRGGLNKRLLEEDWGPETIHALMRKRPGLVTNEGPVGADVYAMDHGYAGADEMINHFLDVDTKRELMRAFVNGRANEAEALAALPEDFAAGYFERLEEESKILARLTRIPTQRAERAQVREIVGSMTLDSIQKRHRYLFNELERARRSVADAFNAGDHEGAQQALEAQRRTALELKAIMEGMREVGQIQASVKTLLRRKTEEAHDLQLRALLHRFLLAPDPGQAAMPLDSFWLSKGYKELIPDSWDNVRHLDRINPAQATLNDYRALHLVARQIWYQGRNEKMLIAGAEKLDFDRTITEIGRSIVIHNGVIPSPDAPYTPTLRENPLQKLTSGLSAFHYEMLKPEEICRSMDGDQDFGAAWTHVYRPIKEAEKAQAALMERLHQELAEAFAPFADRWSEWQKKREMVQLPGEQLPRPFTREQQIMIALNSGNEGNRKALREGWGFTTTQDVKGRPNDAEGNAKIDAIVARLTPEEMDLVEKVWTIIDSIYPLLNAEHKTVTGTELKKVEGRYFPLHFDPEQSDKAAYQQYLEDSKGLIQNVYFRPSPAKGMTMERKGGKLAPLLRFDVIFKHVRDTSHLATHWAAVRDVYKIVNDSRFKDLVKSTLGRNAWNQITPWLQHVARPMEEPMGQFERALRAVRRNTVVAALGLNLNTVAGQPGAMLQTASVIGTRATMEGVKSFVADPHAAIQFVDQRSLAMKYRADSFDRDAGNLMGAHDIMAGPVAKTREGLLWPMKFMDAMTAYPAWLGAYQKAMEAHHWDEAKAIEYADMVVRRTMGSGSAADLAAIQRGAETKKLVTMFYSYFNTTYNLLSASARRFMREGGALSPEAWGNAIKAFTWIVVGQAFYNEAVGSLFKSKEEEPKDWILAVPQFLLATVPIARDVAGPILTGYGYRMSPISQALETPAQLWHSASSDKRPRPGQHPTLKHSIDAVAFGTGLIPSRASFTFVTGLMDLMNGQAENPARLIIPRKERSRR
jgi:hypothetical protein